ncbi:MAG: hypothetical protein ACK5UY_07215 [Holosporales bacterium]
MPKIAVLDSWTLRDALKHFVTCIQNDLCHPNHVIPEDDKPHIMLKIGKNLDRLVDSESIDDIQRYLHMQGLREFFEPLGAGQSKLAFKVRNYVVTIQTCGRPEPVYNISRLVHPTHVKSFDKGWGKMIVEISPYYPILNGTVNGTNKFSDTINSFCKTSYMATEGHCYPPDERVPCNFGQLPESQTHNPKLIIIDREKFLPHIFKKQECKQYQNDYSQRALTTWEEAHLLNLKQQHRQI